MRGLERWAALGGVLYVVLFVIGTILQFSGSPAGDAAPSKVISWYSDSGHRTQLNIGWALIGLGLFSFLWFLTALRQALIRLVGEGFLPTLATVGGAIYAALALAAASVSDGIRTMSDDTYHHQVYGGLIHAAGDASYVILAGSGIAMASMIFALAIASFAYGLLPRCVGWFGVVAGVAAIFSLLFFTMLVWLLWIAVASVLLFRRAPAPAHVREAVAAT